jgi:steroid delta-isomerase-like uncharacterized protein
MSLPGQPAKHRSAHERDARTVLMEWIEAFASRDPVRIAGLYHIDAVNWQVADEPVVGRDNIRNMVAQFFVSFPDSYAHVENVMADGDWAAWEWTGGGTFLRDLGTIKATGRTFAIRGCGFFQVIDGKIKLQRGYWDKASWYRQIGVPLSASIK